MRLHSLRLRGVGPFRDEFSIDFDALGQHRLFLIDGDTGSGKSTIIDAIVFALYGETADTAGGDRMVSDFLPANFPKADRPFVELVFAVESGVYRVLREPRYPYINRNGKDSIQNPTLRLERLPNESSADGQVIATGLQEASAEILRVVQLDRQQFQATMVLAQGQFARFLRSSPEERKSILERVFGTRGYGRIEAHLKDQRSQAIRRREQATASCQDAAARFHQAASLALEADEWRAMAGADPQEALDRAEQRLAEVRREDEVARVAREAAQKARSEAALAREQAALRVRHINEKQKLLDEQRQLHDDESSVREARRRLELHARAKICSVALGAARRARSSEQHRRAELEACAAKLAPDHASLLDRGPLEPDQVAVVVERASQEIAALGPAVEAEAALPTLREQCSDLQEEVGAAAARLQGLEEQLAALPERLARLREERSRLGDPQVQITAHTEALTEATTALKRCEDLERLRVELSDQERTCSALSSELEQARTIAHAVESDYHANIAGVLARELRPHTPCPVCGAEEHPTPAAAPSADISSEAVEQARDAMAGHESTLKAASEHLGEIREKVAAVSAQLAGKDADHWRHETQRLEGLKEQARQAATAAEALDEQVSVAERALQALQQERLEVAEGQASAKAQLELAQGEVKRLDQVVARDRGEHSTVAARVAAMEQRNAALGAWARAGDELRAASAAVLSTAEQLHEAMGDNGFEAEEQIDAAVLPDDDERTLRERVRAHDQAQAGVRARLDSAELRAVDVTEQVDLAGVEQRLAEAVRVDEEAARVAGRASDVAAAAQATWEELARTVTEARRTADEVRPVIRMADAVNGMGPNRLGVPLSQYVVLRRFVDVVEAANLRLLQISDGRYRLEADHLARHGREQRRGLGLRIRDERTDQPRDVTTLSGGETFYTSLALALGLADVVQSESGGVHMGTLFVDEGFGSLDSETLEAVMSVLTGLGQGDRVVGVISHVAEMKQSIPFRVHVRRPDPNGPSVISVPD